MIRLLGVNIDKTAKIVASHAHMAGIESTINSELAKRGLRIESEERPSVVAHSGHLSVSIFKTLGDNQYDQLMSLPETYIGDTDTVSCNFSKTVVAMPEGVETRIAFYLSAELREDDLTTLRMLGKVHTEVRPATVEESVSCTL